MPQREDDTDATILILNMIYERQIKKVIQYLYAGFRPDFAEKN